MNDIANAAEYDCAQFGALNRFLRQRLLKQLRLLRHGRLLLIENGEQLEFGQPIEICSDLQIRVEVLGWTPRQNKVLVTNHSPDRSTPLTMENLSQGVLVSVADDGKGIELQLQ